MTRPPNPVGPLTRRLPDAIGARLLLLIVLALAPLLLLLGWVYHESYQIRRAQVLQTELEVARGVAATFTAFVEDVRHTSHVAGRAILTFSTYTQEKATRVLSDAVAQYRSMCNLSWVAPDGTILASSLPELVGHNLAHRDYFQTIAAGAPWIVGNLMERGSVTRSPLFTIAAAVRDEADTLRGVVVAGVEPTGLNELILAQQRPGGGAYTLFDRAGVLVSLGLDLPLTWDRRTYWRDSDPLLRRTLETGLTQRGVVRLEILGGQWLAARVPIDDTGWVAGAALPRDAALDPIRRALRRDALFALAATALALLLAWAVAGTIATPLRRLKQDTEVLRGGVPTAHNDPRAPAEVRQVRRAVEAMATELGERARALGQSHRLLSGVIDATPDLIAALDPHRRYLAFNRAYREEFRRIFGRDIEVGTDMGNALTHLPGDRAKALAMWGRALRGENFSLTETFGDPARERKVFEMRFGPVLGSRGEVIGAAHVARDVTTRELAEEALARSRALLAEAERLSHTGAWEWDVAADRWTFSDEWCAIHGVPAQAVHIAERLPIAHPQDRDAVVRAFAAVREGAAAYDLEHRIVRQDNGAVRVVHARGQYLRDAHGRVVRVYGFVQDITEQRQDKEALVRRTEELERMNAELEEFAYVASHDLKAPLRAVANLALVIDEDAGALLDEENRGRLRLLRERVKTMDALIEGLLRYARLGRGGRQSGRVELATLLREVVDGLPLPPGFAAQWREPLPALVADPLELRQIFQNLIANAAAHHDRPEQGHVWVSAREEGRWWHLEVADDGPGIPGHLRERAFRMFATSGKSGHSGIGLAVVRKLVIANGGRIEVADNTPRGAVFHITWPKR